MELVIDGTKLSIDYDSVFVESISALRKKKSLSLKCTLYLKVKVESSKELEFVKNLDRLADTVLVKKSNSYFWVFNGCKIIDKSLKKEYYRPWDLSYAEECTKWTFEISFSYEEVFGTNKESVVKREIALNNLFSRDQYL